MKKERIKAIMKEVLIYSFIIFVAAFIAPRYMYAKTIVDGDSMETTLHHEDLLIQEKLSYIFVDPARYDIVVFQSPEVADESWVKRIIGLPGEEIQIIDGEIYMNGSLLEDETYGTGSIDYYGIAKEPFIIPEGEYFVMGDNRADTNSYDSRYPEVKTIKAEAIEGHILCRVSPRNSIGFLD